MVEDNRFSSSRNVKTFCKEEVKATKIGEKVKFHRRPNLLSFQFFKKRKDFLQRSYEISIKQWLVQEALQQEPVVNCCGLPGVLGLMRHHLQVFFFAIISASVGIFLFHSNRDGSSAFDIVKAQRLLASR